MTLIAKHRLKIGNLQCWSYKLSVIEKRRDDSNWSMPDGISRNKHICTVNLQAQAKNLHFTDYIMDSTVKGILSRTLSPASKIKTQYVPIYSFVNPVHILPLSSFHQNSM